MSQEATERKSGAAVMAGDGLTRHGAQDGEQGGTTTARVDAHGGWRAARRRGAGLLLAWLAAAGVAAGCAEPVGFVDTEYATDDDAATDTLERRTSPVIVGSVDWQETTSLPRGSGPYQASRAVGLLLIPAVGTRCTAFLVAPDVVLTNHHCIGRPAEARGATVTFDFERGISLLDARTYACDELLHTDARLDFSLLRCRGDDPAELPGDAYGVAQLSSEPPTAGEAVYLVHQNCDYYSSPGCEYTKKLSPGEVMELDADVFLHQADALGGSSGSPVFAAATDRVVGVHHAGYGNLGTGRGDANQAIVAAEVRAAIERVLPGLLAASPQEPALPAADGDPYGEVLVRQVRFYSPHPYADDSSIERIYQIPGAARVRAHFTRIDTEPDYDVVVVGNDDFTVAYSGNLGEVTTDWYDGEQLFVRFESDDSVTGWGFSLSRIEYQQL